LRTSFERGGGESKAVATAQNGNPGAPISSAPVSKVNLESSVLLGYLSRYNLCF
jgi:hypothetical protein